MPSAIALVDCNNFYASCERVFDARLVDRPVVVPSNNDGNIVARSNEVKALGIENGAPLFKVRPLLEAHDAAILSSNYELYGDMSNRVMTVLSDFTDEIENYSIDEAFMRLHINPRESFAEIGREIRRRVLKYTGIPVSVGIAETKTLSKIANHHAKRSLKANGVLDLARSPYQELALSRVPVADVWGVGSRYAEMLEARGIKTALDLRNAPDEWVRDRMTVVGLRLVQELRGVACIPLEITPPAKKLLTVSRSFGSATESYDELRAAIVYYVSRAAEKLRRQKLAAGSITVFIETDRFKPEPQYANAVTLTVAPKSDSTIELRDLALSGLAKIFRAGFGYRRAGVTLGGLELAERVSLRLWENERYERHRRLMAAIDRLNAKYGRDAVRCGLFQSEGVWRTRFGQRSPRYTTCWNEIMWAE
ncbi:MAG: Protein UmuC [Gammaproteobacteria bacterium]|nr:Protein UmuC [Gammaproteobacteria bacterium]